ncbi:MAG: hypothetical protein IT424_07100 [Pirellulales bacterium]|nr:hypothetical protein [Pirellulales bacterium]
MHRVAVAFAVSAALSTASGCSDGLVDVTARVLLDGQPVSGAAVTLMPAGGTDAHEAYGSSNEQGVVEAFTTTARGDGVRPGDYKVLVNKAAEDAPQEIPRLNPNDPDALKRFQEATRGGNTAYTRTALPRAYLDPAQTPLKVSITPDSDEIVLELKSNEAK